MKHYVKPSIEVISMKTSESIADNLIKTIYTRAAGETSYTAMEEAGTYDASIDLVGSDI